MIKKTGIQPVDCDVSTQLAFSSDSKYLWFATKHENTLVCLEMSHKFDLSTKYCIDTTPCKLKIFLSNSKIISITYLLIIYRF